MTSVDARNTTNLTAFKGTDYQRPEDMQKQTLNGNDYLYFTTTSTGEVYRIDLKNSTISVFVNTQTINLATGVAVEARSTVSTISPSTATTTSTWSKTAPAAATTTSGSRTT